MTGSWENPYQKWDSIAQKYSVFVWETVSEYSATILGGTGIDSSDRVSKTH